MIKTISIIAFIANLLVGCTQVENLDPIELFNENFKSYIQDSAHDPSSYQFIGSTFLDTIYVVDNITKVILKHQSNKRILPILQSSRDSILQSENSNPVAAYLIYHSCRMNNKLGALNIFNYYVEADRFLNVLGVYENIEEIPDYPGGYPHENEIHKIFSQFKSEGDKIYRLYCIVCHGLYGKLELNGAKDITISEQTLEERITIISEGKNLMTPFKGILTEDQIKKVAEYTMTME